MAEIDPLAFALAGFESDRKSHDKWSNQVDQWYASWRGVAGDEIAKSGLRNKMHPPYLLQVFETLTAGVLDPHPVWPVSPRERMLNMDMVKSVQAGADSLEALLNYQRDRSKMVQKQRTHRVQGLVAGLTVWKTCWDYSERKVTHELLQDTVDDWGYPAGTETVEVEGWEAVTDDPSVDVVDVRDFIWHESATTVQGAQRITHRVWMSWDELKQKEADGYYENVDDLKESKDFSGGLTGREQTLFDVNRAKDQIEVLECWVEGGKRVITIANRKVVIRDKPNPYAHGQYPFIAAAPIPDLFRIPGISVVELVQDLQKMLWKIQNGRHDNLDMINSGIVLIRDDVLDKDGFIFAPQEQWLVPDKDAVSLLEMPQFPAQVSLEAENLLKADIQGIPGASPALQGQADSSTQTATEVSLLSNLAQRRLAMEKAQFTIADTEVAEQWVELNRQFLSEERYVGIVGEGGEEGWKLVHPDQFKDYRWQVDVDSIDESLMRQEKLAEATSRFQVALQAVQPMAMIGSPLNMKAFMEDVLDAAGIKSKDKYFSPDPQPAAAAAGGAPPGAPPGPGGGAPMADPNAVSAPQATDQNAPSNPFSQSPVAALSRLGAMSGGPSNA